MNDNKVLMSITKTRKAFIIEYFCAALLLFIILAAAFKGITIKHFLKYITVGVVITAIFSAELSRILHRCDITQSKVLIVEGLIKQTKKHIFISAITDVDMKQNYKQRFFGYGNIHIRSASGQKALELKDIDNPGEIMEKLEGLIHKNRTSKTSC